MDAVTTEDLLQILVVDDEENILTALKRLFRKKQYDVLTANSGNKGLKILHDNPGIALIISDQRMPEMSGVDFLEQAKKLAPDATRMILTGYADVNAAIEGINKGEAFRYITKPWDDEKLVDIVDEAVLKFTLIKANQRLTRIVKEQNEELKEWNSELESKVREQTQEIRNQNEELEKLNKSLKENFSNSILAFSGLIELRDKGTGSHSRDVAKLSVEIARKMRLSGGEIETITVAALLHDIGKIGIPDELLSMDLDTMDIDGRKEYIKHPVRGQTAIDSVDNLRKAGSLIRHHHECYNGAGFPDGLSGEKIPLGSRIIAIADFIEKTIKSLKGNNTIQTTLNKVKDELKTNFDPKIYSFTEESVKKIYLKDLKEICLEDSKNVRLNDSTKTSSFEKEYGIDNIEPGMVTTRDVKSGTGIVLLTRGAILDDKSIHSLRRYYKLDPSENGIFVLVKRK